LPRSATIFGRASPLASMMPLSTLATVTGASKLLPLSREAEA